MTPRQIYALPYTVNTVNTAVNRLAGMHVPEIPDYEFDYFRVYDRIELRTHKSHMFDDRRVWELQTVWFDGKPVMIIQNAGREGNDHSERFVTDPDAYIEMVKYMTPPLTFSDADVGMDDDMKELTYFYSHDLNDEFETW